MQVYRPRGRIWTAAAATMPVVSIREMKAQCKVSHDEENDRLLGIEAAAVAWVEKYLQRLLTVRAVTLRLPGLPVGKIPVELSGGRVASLTSVVADGVAVTGATVAGDSPALMFPATDWPVVTGEDLPVTITYTAGFASVPADVRTAVLMIGEAMYDNFDGGFETPAVMALLSRHRIKAL